MAWSSMAKEVLAYSRLRGNSPFCSGCGKGLGAGEGKAWLLAVFSDW